MKKIATIFIAVAGLVFVAGSAMAAGQALRISQVYGNGGNAGATYNQDYIEIINASNAAVDISGWAVEYASSAGSWGTTFVSGGVTFNNYVVFPQGTTIKPCNYLLIACAAAGTVGAAIPAPDFTMPTNLSGTAGNVGIFSQVNPVTACASVIGLVDKVGYGTGALCPEGTVAGAHTTVQAVTRNNCGLTDTDNNSADFTSIAPAPHNAAFGASTCCLATPTSSTTWGKIKSIYR